MTSDHSADFENTLVGRPVDAPDFLKPGAVIGNDYVLEAMLGRGGMGLVYRAKHRMMGQSYALKIMATDRLSDVFWQRFQREAQVLAKLNHPNIVQVFNLGIDREKYPYCVMELLSGESLSQLIAREGPLEIEDAIDYFWAVADALAAAHDNKIIHRDVKPANIMLCTEGSSHKVKLVDFGVARVLSSDGGFATRNRVDQRLTEVGEIFGSPLYMSPEQCLGDIVDHRSDIYSFGVSLFEALTGHVPFRGQTALDTFNMHINTAAPRLRDKLPTPAFPPELERMVARMLEKKPDRRYQSMGAVIVDMQRLAEGKSVGGASDDERTNIDEEEAEEKPSAPGRTILIGLVLTTLLCLGAFFGINQIWSAKPRQKPAIQTAVEAVPAPSPDVVSPHSSITREELPGGKLQFDFGDNLDDGSIAGSHERMTDTTGKVTVTPPILLKVTFPKSTAEVLRLLKPADCCELIVQHAYDKDDWKTLWDATRGWTGLWRLDFRNCRIDGSLIRPLEQMKTITVMEFRDCIWQPKNIAGLKTLTHLEKFVLHVGFYETAGKGLDVPRLMEDLSHAPKLHHLILDMRRGIDDETFARVAELKHVQILHLLGCKWTRERFRAVSRMPSLQMLCIKHGEFASDELRELSAAPALRTVAVLTEKQPLAPDMPELKNAAGAKISISVAD